MKPAPSHRNYATGGLASAQGGEPPVVTPPETPLHYYVKHPELVNFLGGHVLRKVLKQALEQLAKQQAKP